MNIIIPVGGKGERFSKCGFTSPKPLISILNKPMILYALDNLTFRPEDTLYIIYYLPQIQDCKIFENTIHQKYPDAIIALLSGQTSGAAETLYSGIKQIGSLRHSKTVILDCDAFYTQDILSMYRDMDLNAVFYTKNTQSEPIYSYIQLNSDNHITQIAEKRKISDNANTGIYCFRDIDELTKYSKYVVENGIMFQNECYTSCIIDSMIQRNEPFMGIELSPNNVFSLGTPEQVEEYIQRTYLFLFDLDGTLVYSDSAYYATWEELLLEYDIVLTPEIFQTYITGSVDSVALSSIVNGGIAPNNSERICEISNKKDEIFIKHISNVDIVPNALEFLREIRRFGHKIAIITNCNRRVAEHILRVFEIDELMDTLIIGNECANPKPYPDPYLNAISYYGSIREKAIIFEDSKTGLLSASSVNPQYIIGVETCYSKGELYQYNVNATIPNYTECNVSEIIRKAQAIYTPHTIESCIVNSLVDVSNVILYSTKLKGGFISDVIQVDVVYRTGEVSQCIFKMENQNDTFLTHMSNWLNLYEREYYFYETISEHVPVKTPKLIGIVKNADGKTIGILLENLQTDQYKLGLDLNNEPLEVSLSVIRSFAKMHATFWNKDIDRRFASLVKNDNPMFCPSWTDFVSSKWPLFKMKWKHVLTLEQMELGEYIVANYGEIQRALSDINLTLCHGDVKSPNIFYKIQENGAYTPYFIDWQYIVLGKGVQDLVFFMIESFHSDYIQKYKCVFKEYYYERIREYGIHDYDRNTYNTDFVNASYYFPFFVAMWFGTLSEDELIDVQFPLRFIKNLFHFYCPDKSKFTGETTEGSIVEKSKFTGETTEGRIVGK